MTHPVSRAISELVKGIAHNYAALKIEESRADDRLIISVTPHSSDYPLLCGSGGRHIRALKFLTMKASAMANLKGDFNLHEGFEGQWQPSDTSTPFDLEAFKRLLATFLSLCFTSPVGMEFRESGRMGCRGCKPRLKVLLAPGNGDAGDNTTIAALDAAFYPYGAKCGVVISISRAK